jgi:hypothetical protein
MTPEEERMNQAVSNGTDFAVDQLDLGDRDMDLGNIFANAIALSWKLQEPPRTWPEFIAEQWSAEPGTSEDPATWRDFAPCPASAAAAAREGER